MALNLIMNTFAGRYLGERSNKNIGHENINFFKPSDCDGKWLLWFNSDGVIPEEKIGTQNGQINLLMVTNFANEKDKFRVLAYARNCHIVNGATIPSQKQSAKVQRFNAFNSQFPNAKYGNKKVGDIFKDNVYHGNPDSENTLSTFFTEPENIFVPTERNLTIQISENENSTIKQNMANEKMRLYVKNNDDFDNLINSINWEPIDGEGNLPGFPPRSIDFKEDESFFSATRNEKDELTLSNIITYSLSKSSELLCSFLNHLFPGRNYQGNMECFIKREDKHVDLTILLNNMTIIIENKIDSTIVEYGTDKVLLKEKILKAYNSTYKPKKEPKKESSKAAWRRTKELYDNINQIIDDSLEEIPDGAQLCQLSKYYIQSKINAMLNNRDVPIHYYFLLPNYTINKFNFNEDETVSGWAYSDNYKKLTYEELYDIFESVHNYPYREDILKEFTILKSEIDDYDQRWQIYSFLKKAEL